MTKSQGNRAREEFSKDIFTRTNFKLHKAGGSTIKQGLGGRGGGGEKV